MHVTRRLASSGPHGRRTNLVLAVLVAALVLAAPARAADPLPIPSPPTTAPAFLGAPATPRPVAAPLPAQHPFLAPNERSNLHNDGAQTDSYRRSGPLGRDVQVRTARQDGECASITFTRDGRIVTVCVGPTSATLRLIDPGSLRTIAAVPVGRRPLRPGQNPFQDFSGGGYFFLDDRDRAVVATGDRRLQTHAVEGDRFRLVRDVSLADVVGPEDGLVSALPDYDGHVWFLSRDGVVGTVDATTGRIAVRDLGETIGNSFAVDGAGLSIVTDAALYEMRRGPDGRPEVLWRQAYDTDGTRKPGQSQAGSGTTPTLMPGGLVAITDNADPVNVVVFRRARALGGRPREVCRQPVFPRGRSSTDQSLVTDGRNLIAENNHGYEGPPSVSGGRTTEPGLARVDVDAAAGRCRLRWTSDEVAPSAVPKLALGSGLVYTWTKPADPSGQDPWYLTAIEHETGRTAFRVLVGAGIGLNNNYAPIVIGPDGTAYIGALGGIVAVRDRVAPDVPFAPVPPGGSGVDGTCVVPAGFSSVGLRSRSGGRLQVAFTRRAAEPVDVDVFRVSAGRRVLGERLVARFADRSASLVWDGRSRRSGRPVGDGTYLVRLVGRDASGRRDVRRLVAERRDGRWLRRRSHARPVSCGLLRVVKLLRPVWGGTSGRALGVAYRTTARARVRVELVRDGRVVRRLPVATRVPDRTHRVRFGPTGRPPGVYTVRITARPTAGARTVRAQRSAERL